MQYYEYNEFLAGAILDLFSFEEALEFIVVRRPLCS